jgi:hypothetical protein
MFKLAQFSALVLPVNPTELLFLYRSGPNASAVKLLPILGGMLKNGDKRMQSSSSAQATQQKT